MTLNLQGSNNDSECLGKLPRAPCDNKDLIVIPPSELTIVKEKPSASYLHNEEAQRTSHSKTLKKSCRDNTKVKRPKFVQDVDSDIDVTSSSTCSMNKERIIEARATLLTPKSVYKVYGNNFRGHSNQQMSLHENPALSNACSSNRLSDKPVCLEESYLHSSAVSAPFLVKGSLNDSVTSSVSSLSTSTVCEDNVNHTLIASTHDTAYDQTLNENFDGRTGLSRLLSVTSNYSADHSLSENFDDLLDSSERVALSNATCSSLVALPQAMPTKALQLSPSMFLPVSEIEGNSVKSLNTPLSSMTLTKFPKFYLDNSTSEDIESVDRSSEVSSFSCSSLSLDREGLMLIPRYPEQQDSQPVDRQQQAAYQQEIENLRQSLKLAKADTAILVSSKQQLQLDRQDLLEKNTSLKNQLQKIMQQAAESEKNVAVLSRTNSINQKRHADDILRLEDELRKTKQLAKEKTEELEVAVLEHDVIQSNSIETNKNLKAATNKNGQLEKEVSRLLWRNVKLESMLQEALEDKTGNNEYVNVLRQERDDFAKQLHTREREMDDKHTAISQLEERLGQVSAVNIVLTTTKEELQKSLLIKNDLITKLEAQVAAKALEKEALDKAIWQLHENLFRVEAGFSKIKREVAQKNSKMHREASLKSHFESEITAMKVEVEDLRMKSAAHTQRINDKNNQISQLLDQLKNATLAKQRCNKELESWKSKLALKEKSRKMLEKKEKELTRTVDEQQQTITECTVKIKNTDDLLIDLTASQKQLEGQILEKDKTISNNDRVLSMLKNEVLSLQQRLTTSQDSMVSNKQTFAENELRNRKLVTENLTLTEQLENLKNLKNSVKSSTHHREGKTEEEDCDVREVENLIAELQTSRRQLTEEVTRLHEEKIICDQNHKEKVEKERSRGDTIIQKQRQAIERLEIAKSQLENDLHQNLQTKERNRKSVEEEFLQQISHMKEGLSKAQGESTKVKSDLTVKTKEVEALLKVNSTLREELTFAKEEINNTAFKLISEINEKESYNEISKRLASTETERNKLEDVVKEQQRYLSSLQIHYQQWANDATVKFEQLQRECMKTKIACNFQDNSAQTEHDTEPAQTFIEPVSIEQDHCDASTQTEHDEKPLASSPLKEHCPPNMVFCRKCGRKVSMGPYGDAETKFDVVDMDELPLKSDPTSALSHFRKSPSDSSGNACIVAQAYHGILSNQSTQTASAIFFPTDFSEASCQTSHDMEVVASSPVQKIPSAYHKFAQCEMYTQTEHDLEHVGVFETVYENFHRKAKATSHAVVQTEITIDPHAVPSAVTVRDFSVQTEHDFDVIGFKYSSLKTREDIRKCSTSSTQVNFLEEIPVGETHFRDTYAQIHRDSLTEITAVSEIIMADKASQAGILVLRSTFPRSDNETQTECDLSLENHSSVSWIYTNDCFTQTEHDDVAVGQKRRPATTPVEAASVSCQTDIVCISQPKPLRSTSFTQTDTVLPESKKVLLVDCYSQTDHNMWPVGHITSLPSHHEFPKKKSSFSQTECCKQTDVENSFPEPCTFLNESFTQTEHDQELIGSLSYYDQYGSATSLVHVATATQTSSNQIEVVDCCCQTDLDFCLTTTVKPDVSFCDFSTQTDHNLEAVGSITSSGECSNLPLLTTSSLHAHAHDLKESSSQTSPKLQKADVTMAKNDWIKKLLACEHCGNFVSIISSQFNNDKVLLVQSSTQTSPVEALSPFPSPEDVLCHMRSEDATKLKAYKQTVKLLKKKLKDTEKKLLIQQEEVTKLQIEVDTLKCEIAAEKDHESADVDNSSTEKDAGSKLSEEVSYWKDIAEKKETLVGSLQKEIEQMQKTQESELERIKRKEKARRMLKEKNTREANERMEALTTANERMRQTVSKLQVKLAANSQQLELSNREKLRYQQRARRLQTDLRSLAWLSTSQPHDKKEASSKTASSNPAVELPSSVHEIDAILQDLRKEIGVLEEQLNHHSSAVLQSKAHLQGIRTRGDSITSTNNNTAPLRESTSPGQPRHNSESGFRDSNTQIV